MTRNHVPGRCKALLVYPEFNPNSFWNYQETCKLAGARYPAAPLGLITVAALLPDTWQLRLVNRNTEHLEESDLDWADVVLTGGMLSQQRDTLSLVAMAQAHGTPVVLGGPDVTSSPHVYAAADYCVLGEAEEALPAFLAAWEQGDERGIYRAERFADMTTSPVPRFDLLTLDHYLHVGVQYSRGCPFSCEFCDIIELYGRVPRVKTTEQILCELDSLYSLGYRGHVDFVDDNFIGNKKSLKHFLPALAAWLEEHGHPFAFTTEASINLADDGVLLQMMKETGFFALFVGIESPDDDVLIRTQKKQNISRDIAASIRRIYQAGMFVNGGFIMGFDSEQQGVADAMIECIEDTAVPICMVGLLHALPSTQLARRLLEEGRLHPDGDLQLSDDRTDQCTAGLNFETLRPRWQILDDYRTVLTRVYEPAAFFGRVRRAGRMLRCSGRRHRPSFAQVRRDGRAFLRLALRMGVRDAAVRREWWRTLADCALHNPRALQPVVSMMALYLHVGPFARYVVARLTRQIEEAIQTGSPATCLRA